VKVDLPESTAVAPATEQPPLVFSLKRGTSGALELYLNGELTDDAAVREMFRARGLPGDDQHVTLSADQSIPYGDVIQVVDLLESIGLKKLSLDTRHVEPR
jgi:biopolymer transport protein ExbD